jgi:hypothetical protein
MLSWKRRVMVGGRKGEEDMSPRHRNSNSTIRMKIAKGFGIVLFGVGVLLLGGLLLGLFNPNVSFEGMIGLLILVPLMTAGGLVLIYVVGRKRRITSDN